MIACAPVSIAASDAVEVRSDASAAVTARRVAALCVALFAFLLWASPRSSLWDRDEALYARAALDVAKGGVLVPSAGGVPWLEKPPLLVWMQAAALGAGLPLETAARVPSALALALCGWFVFRTASILRPAPEGSTAAAILLASPLVLLNGAAGTTDALLLAGTTASLWALALFVRRGPSALRGAGLAAAMAAGLLAKGPPGVVLPLLAAAPVILALRPGDRLRFACAALAASLAAVAVFACWAIPANVATNGLVVSELFGRHVLRRALEPNDGHGGFGAAGLLVYPSVILAGFAPWTLFLPAGLRAFPPRRSPEAALVFGGILAPILVFTLAATKLPAYVLPSFAPLAILAAAGVHAGSTRARAGLALYLPGAVPWLALFGAAAFLAPTPALRIAAAALLAIAAVGAVAGIALLFGGRPRAAARAVGAGVASIAIVLGAVLPLAEPLRPVPATAAAVRRAGPGPVAVFGFDEPSLDVYVSPRRVEHLPSVRAASAWAASPAPGVLVTTAALAKELGLDGYPGLRVLAAADGWNVSTGRRVSLVAFQRSGA
jgi:4-amino-4-deoxy-L-arabinose transferase-like glycosyltransferase